MNTLNYATQNKWIAQIPLKQILDDVDDLSLNLTTFAIPSIDINSIEVPFKGIPIELPGTIVQTGGKELLFDYIIDSEWKNYKALYSWVDHLARLTKIVQGDYSSKFDDDDIYKNFSIPVTMHLLDEYKNRVLEFKYYNCWIKGFSELSMSYIDEPDELSHNFTIAYSDFEMIPV